MSRDRRADDEAFEDSSRPRPRPRPSPPEVEPDRPGPPPLPRRRRSDPYEDDDYDDRPRPARRLIPRNGLALTGYYLAFLGLIVILGTLAVLMYNPVVPGRSPLFFFVLIFGVGGLLAILAIVFGILGLVRANRRPEAGGAAHSVISLVLGSLIVVGLICLVLLGLLVLPRGL